MRVAEVEGRHEFPDLVVYHDDDVWYTPFVGEDGRVGYAVRDSEAREAFIYLVPSEGGASPDVFVYTGLDGDAGMDASVAWFLTDIDSLIEGT